MAATRTAENGLNADDNSHFSLRRCPVEGCGMLFGPASLAIHLQRSHTIAAMVAAEPSVAPSRANVAVRHADADDDDGVIGPVLQCEQTRQRDELIPERTQRDSRLGLTQQHKIALPLAAVFAPSPTTSPRVSPRSIAIDEVAHYGVGPMPQRTARHEELTIDEPQSRYRTPQCRNGQTVAQNMTPLVRFAAAIDGGEQFERGSDARPDEKWSAGTSTREYSAPSLYRNNDDDRRRRREMRIDDRCSESLKRYSSKTIRPTRSSEAQLCVAMALRSANDALWRHSIPKVALRAVLPTRAASPSASGQDDVRTEMDYFASSAATRIRDLTPRTPRRYRVLAPE